VQGDSAIGSGILSKDKEFHIKTLPADMNVNLSVWLTPCIRDYKLLR